MKRLFAFLWIALLTGACAEKEVIFYSVTYPVTQVEAVVTLTPPDPEDPEDSEDSDTPETPDSGDEGEIPEAPGEAETRAETPSEADRIAAAVVAEAPVQAGGWYRLDFKLYNGGPLTVAPTAEGMPFAGEFVKEPGTTQLQFAYDERSYTYDLASYLSETEQRCTVLVIDVTAEWQERYPEAGILRVQRREYTSTPY